VELLQVLGEDGVPTGESLPEAEVHAKGLWHGAVAVWVMRPGDLVLLRRNPGHDLCDPLRLGPSARAHTAGHGSPSSEAARAVERQLSIDALRHGLTLLGTYAVERRFPGGVDRELQDVYVGCGDEPLEELTVDPAQVDTVYEVPLARALGLFEGADVAPAPGFDSMQRVSNALLYEEDLPKSCREALLAQLRAVEAWVAARQATGEH